MQRFTVAGPELFDSFPEPVFWTCRRRLAYWNHAAERLCRETGVRLEEGGELPAPLEPLDGTENRAAKLSLAGQGFHALGQSLSEGRLFLLRPAAEEATLNGRRLGLLMERMRGPIANLFTAAQMMEEPEDSPVPPVLTRNLYRILRMTNEVEYVHRLENPKEFFPVVLDLAGLCREVVRQAGPLSKRYGGGLTYEEEESSLLVLGESDLLEMMLYQLISNAWRASGQNEISVRLCRRGDRAMLTVNDQGGGMDEAVLATAFDPNSGGERLTDLGAGLGLGIPICQQIAQLHGGSLVLENRSGHGVSATFSLPAARGKLSLHTPGRPPRAESSIPRVLLELSDVLPREAFCRRELE